MYILLLIVLLVLSFISRTARYLFAASLLSGITYLICIGISGDSITALIVSVIALVPLQMLYSSRRKLKQQQLINDAIAAYKKSGQC
jgi:hypothetical protein